MNIAAVYHTGPKTQDISRLTNSFSAVIFNRTRSLEELQTALNTAEILVMNGTEFTEEIGAAIRTSSTLKFVQFTSSGVDAVLRAGGLPTHIVAANVAGLRAANLSEHAFALLLFFTRQIRTIETARNEGRWIKRELFPHMVSLRGRTMLIVGMGAIGQAVARKAKAFGMRVLGVSRAYRPDQFVERVWPREDADDAFRQADVLMIAAPAEAGTIGYVDRSKFALLKPSTILINVSRGDVIDEAALIDACRERRIAGAGLDVMETEPLPADNPLWTLDNVLMAPHVGGAGSDQLGQLLDKIAVNIRHYLAGEPLENRVTF